MDETTKNQTDRRSVISNAAKLDAKTPIPLETNGMGFITKKGRRYVPFFDSGDNFFQILLEAALLSPTNFACIGSKTKFSIGKGLRLAQKKDSAAPEDKELAKWCRRVNKKGQSFNKILKGIFNNRYAAGNSFIELVRFSVGKTKYFQIYLRNYIDCRLNMPGADEDDIPTSVFISKTFRKKGVWNFTEKDDPIEIALYNGDPKQKWTKGDDGVERLVIHLKNEVSGYDYYGMPSNVASLPQQILEYKFARYNMDNFDNNMVIGGVITVEASLTPDEAAKFSKDVTGAHTGDGKRGKYVILASEQGIKNSRIENFDQDKEYDYIEGDKRIEEKIILSNEWSKALIDPQSSGLGNSGKQIKEIYETKMNTVIAPEQTAILEDFVIPVMEMIDAWTGSKWASYAYEFDKIPVLGIGTEIDINSVLTVDEGREAIGYQTIGGESGKARIKTGSQLSLFDPSKPPA